MTKSLIKHFRHNNLWYMHEIDSKTDDIQLRRSDIEDAPALLTYTHDLRVLDEGLKQIGRTTINHDDTWLMNSEIYGVVTSKTKVLLTAEVDFSMAVLQKMSEEPASVVEN